MATTIAVGDKLIATGPGECFETGRVYTVVAVYDGKMDLECASLDTTVAGVRIDEPNLETYTEAVSIAARTDFSRGFDSGNYGNAYESQYWDTWSARHNFGEHRSEAYNEGLFLGFFSSYELHEVPARHRDRLATLRGRHPERAG